MLEPCNAKVLRTVLRGLGASNRAWLLGGCVALRQQYLAGNGAHFSLVLELETIGRTEEGSKANDDGANRWCSFPRVAWIFPPPCDSAANQYRVGLIGVSHKAASSFFYGGVIECSSRMKGNFQVRFLGD